MESELPFTMVVDDPSGNSFVENPSAPNRDPALTVRQITRQETNQWLLAINQSWLCDWRMENGEATGATDGSKRGVTAQKAMQLDDVVDPRGATHGVASHDRCRSTNGPDCPTAVC